MRTQGLSTAIDFFLSVNCLGASCLYLIIATDSFQAALCVCRLKSSASASAPALRCVRCAVRRHLRCAVCVALCVGACACALHVCT